MKIDLKELSCQLFDIDVPMGERELKLRFEHLTQGQGQIGIASGTTTLESIAIRELLVSLLSLPLGAAGDIRTTTPAMLSGAIMNGVIKDGVDGALHMGLVNTERLILELGETLVESDVRGDEVGLNLGDGGKTSIGTLSLRGTRTNAAGFDTTCDQLSVSGLRVGWGNGLQIEALRANAVDIATSRDNVHLTVAGIDLPEGFSLAGGVLQIPELLVGSATLVVDDLSGESLPAPPPAHDAPEPEVETASPSRIRFDASILDTVNGQLDVDLTMDATVPVLGNRKATHHFRIPIDGGIINYRDVERDLSDLEDAFIDITLRGERLVLERDIPLIPGLEKPILYWALEDSDVELAKQYLVRLRVLPHFELASQGGGGDGKKSKVKLHRLNFDNVVVDLSIDDGPVMRTASGGVLRTSADEISLRGNLHFEPERELEPTTLALTARGLGAAATQLGLSSIAIDAAELEVGAIEDASLVFHGLRPRRLEVTLRNVRLSQLSARV